MNFTSSLISYLICGGTLFCSFEYIFDDKLCNGGTNVYVYPSVDSLSLQGMYVIPYFHPTNLTVTNVSDCDGLSLKLISIVGGLEVEDGGTPHSFYSEGGGSCTTQLTSLDPLVVKHAVLIFSSGLQTNSTYTIKRKQNEAGRKKYLITNFFDDQHNSIIQLEIERNDVQEPALCYPDSFPSTMLSYSGDLTFHQYTWEEDCITVSSVYETLDTTLGDPVSSERFNSTHDRLMYSIETDEFSAVTFYRFKQANNFKFFVQEQQSNSGDPFYLSPLVKVILMNVCPFTFVSIICFIVTVTANEEDD